MLSRMLRLLATTVVVGAVLAVPSVASADSVRLYEHANFRGATFTPRDSQPNFRKIDCFLLLCTNWNDRVSSLHVPAYTCVRLYEHINRDGEYRDFCGDTLVNPNAGGRDYAYVGGDWNDRASSSSTFERRDPNPASTDPPPYLTARDVSYFGCGKRMRTQATYSRAHNRIVAHGALTNNCRLAGFKSAVFATLYDSEGRFVAYGDRHRYGIEGRGFSSKPRTRPFTWNEAVDPIGPPMSLVLTQYAAPNDLVESLQALRKHLDAAIAAGKGVAEVVALIKQFKP